MKDHDCYSCKNRGSVPGSAHSSCSLLNGIEGAGILHALNPSTLPLNFLSVKIKGEKVDPIVLNEHGVRNGWAIWPINFDPVWVDKCIFYQNKTEESESEEGGSRATINIG